MESNKCSDARLWVWLSLPVTHRAQTHITPAVGALRHQRRGNKESPWSRWHLLQEEQRAPGMGSNGKGSLEVCGISTSIPRGRLHLGLIVEAPGSSVTWGCATGQEAQAGRGGWQPLLECEKSLWGAALREERGKLKAAIISKMTVSRYVFFFWEFGSLRRPQSRNTASSKKSNKAKNLRGSSFANTANSEEVESRKVSC